MAETTTKRRTAKITTKPYTPATLSRVYDKASGVCLGYLAPSRDGKEFYQVTCDENAIWHCTCKATIENCCHVKAAKELCEIRVKQGRPACRAAAVIVEDEPKISDEEMAAIASEAHRVADESQAAKEAEDTKFWADFNARIADYAGQQEAGKAKQAEELAAKRRDLVACAAANAAKAGDAIDVLTASAAASAKRASAPLARQGFSLYR